MYRTFIHKGKEFTTRVAIGAGPGGKLHNVLVYPNDQPTGGKEYPANTLDLELVIKRAEQDAREWVDNQNIAEVEEKLTALGFNK